MRSTSAAGRSTSTIPSRVTSSGGRYHFKDDWQFYDTLVTSFEYDDKMISWEGKSCHGMKFYGRDRGSTIMGTTGTVLVDRDGYEIYDLKGKKTERVQSRRPAPRPPADLVGADSMTDAHFANFIAAIRTGEKLNAPIAVGNVAVTMLQLSNIAWEVNRELHLDSQGRQNPERSRRHEILDTRVRERLGAPCLTRAIGDICNAACHPERSEGSAFAAAAGTIGGRL